jgi:hypothetical protein
VFPINYNIVNCSLIKTSKLLPFKIVFSPNAIFFIHCLNLEKHVLPFAFKETLYIQDNNLITTIHTPQLVFVFPDKLSFFKIENPELFDIIEVI